MKKNKDLRVLSARSLIPAIATMLTLTGCDAVQQWEEKEKAKNAPRIDTVRVVDIVQYESGGNRFGNGSVRACLHCINMAGDYVMYDFNSNELAEHAVNNLDTIVITNRIERFIEEITYSRITDNLSFKTRLHREMQR